MTKTKRWLRVLLWSYAISTVLLAIVALLLTFTDPGRRWTADAIEAAVSSEIPGHMEIGRLTRVGMPTVAEDLRFFHPSGREVLHVRHAEVDFDVADALAGKLSFHRAKAQGGRLLMSIDPDGRPSIEAALDFPTRGVDPDPEGGLHYAMRDIHVDGLLMVLRFATDTYRVRDVEGVVSIRREVTEGIRIALRDVSGDLEPKLIGQDVRIRRLDGWLHGKERKVFELRAHASVGDGKMKARIALFDRKETPVEVELDPVEGVGSMLVALALYAQSVFSEDLSIDVGES